MSARVRLGISPCPNDTFAFHALLAGEVRPRGLDLEIELHDVEELNERLADGRLDAAKASFHAALALAGEVVVLPSGSALGHGVGPVLLAAREGLAPGRPVQGRGGVERPPRVLAPGRWTTANLLWRLFHDGEGALEQRVFHEIVPALRSGGAELGVCIHEARFTWREHGLVLVEDLGERFEQAARAPLPLGGIVARRALGADAVARLQDAVRASLEWGLAHREATLPTMRSHAQELAPDVLWAHVDLYVGPRTLELGDEGRAALDALAELARARGLLPRSARALEVA